MRLMKTDVLIAGAGPTGLVLALWLQRLGVGVRIIDKATEPGTTSRALAVNVWVRGKRAARAAFSDIGQGLSPFPFIVM
jgi:2-polyprenyl-6-methoxyphenol hydroxylase-like FAD-dependent oxidoreductase